MTKRKEIHILNTYSTHIANGDYCPKWLRNRLKSPGLEPVLSHTDKSYIASYYRQFFTNIKIKIIKSIQSAPRLINFHFNIGGNLNIIRCAKQLLLFRDIWEVVEKLRLAKFIRGLEYGLSTQVYPYR